MSIKRTIIGLIEILLLGGFAGMLLLVFGNVILRYGFDSGIIMAEEVSRVLFVWLTFGGAYLVAREGGHLGMGAVTDRLGPTARRFCALLAEAASLLCMGLIVVGCWRQIVINIDNYAPITGLPLAVTYMAGLACGLGIGGLNLLAVLALLKGHPPSDGDEQGNASIPGTTHS